MLGPFHPLHSQLRTHCQSRGRGGQGRSWTTVPPRHAGQPSTSVSFVSKEMVPENRPRDFFGLSLNRTAETEQLPASRKIWLLLFTSSKVWAGAILTVGISCDGFD